MENELISVRFIIGDDYINTYLRRIPSVNEEISLSIETNEGFKRTDYWVKKIISDFEIYDDESCDESYRIYLER